MYRIDFSPHGPGGLRAHVDGDRTLESTLGYWQQIAQRNAQLHLRRLLVVDELEGDELAPEQWLALVESMVGSGLEHVRIAHAKPRGVGQAEYCEIYANAAGFTARTFDDERQAERWLRYGDAGVDVQPMPLRAAR
ncbi:hypothetical protein [Cognatiluteimonas telluris]|jgi:hypothetical protein|uniref:hypothetical protein n=1 Tax=Cognatiluteimonas telluris TaxID=1104775 RepID=UPI00140D9260|nr:hypothetical protein [Lysobacter telluris]